MGDFYNFIIKVLDYFVGDTRAKIGTALLSAGGIVKFALSFTVDPQSKEVLLAYGSELDLLGIALIVIGAGLLIYRFFTIQDEKIPLFYAASIDNMDAKSPISAVPKKDRSKILPIELKRIDSYDRDQVLADYQINRILIQERVYSKEVNKAYIACFGSFPYMFLVGSLMRNPYSNITMIDYDRFNNKNKWYTLPVFDNNKVPLEHKLAYNNDTLTIDDELKRLKSLDGDVGISLAYTFNIEKNTIPNHLKDKTLYLTTSVGPRHDILSNEKTQKEFLKDISYYTNELSNKNRIVHFFVSAQSSMCINLGMSYMDNAHGKICLHNYNNEKNSHDWYIEFYKGNIY